MAKRDYYDILGLERGASADEIKKAYRRQAMKYHPDRNPEDGSAAENFKAAGEAYEILSDPQRRALYDRYGHEGVSSTFGSGGFSWSDFTHGAEFEDILGSIFGSFFGGGGGREARFKGRDLRIRYPLQLTDVLEGKHAKIDLTRLEICDGCNGSGVAAGHRPRTCPRCKGSGQMRYNQGFFAINTTCDSCHGEGVLIDHPCKTCHGNGRINKRTEVRFDIPKGVEDGMQLRVNGEGEAGLRGGPRGDLYVSFNVEPDERFKRSGADLLLELPVTFAQAALGDDLLVPTLNGNEVKLDLPPGTQSHTSFRVRGRGLPRSPGDEIRGDLEVRVIVRTPKKLNARQVELLREFAREENGKIPSGVKGLFDKVKEIFE